jgi:hypothetical protein
MGDVPDMIAVRIGDVHTRIADELERLRIIGLVIERSFCRAAADEWSMDESRRRDLQQLDLLLQHLSALKDFVEGLVPNDEGSVDLAGAVRRIPLEGLRARLSGVAAASDRPGSVELF